jgi:ferredoxin--NADP+ reductase
MNAPRFQIVEARFLSTEVKLLRFHAPRIAKRHKPGPFVIVRVHERGERIPLTIAGSDAQAGAITVIVQAVGKTTRLLNRLSAKQAIAAYLQNGQW